MTLRFSSGEAVPVGAALPSGISITLTPAQIQSQTTQSQTTESQKRKGDELQKESHEKKAKASVSVPSARDWISELSNAYFAKMFPVDVFIEYLSVPGNLHTREICFGKHEGGLVRFQNFHSAEGFRKWLSNNSCAVVHTGAVYNKKGVFRTEKDFTAVWRELVFDLDLTDYESVGLLITGCTNPLDPGYAAGWRLAALGARVVHTILKRCFGFEHMCFLFSGRRGWHLHVADHRASIMGGRGRMAVAKLFDFLGSRPGSVRISGFYNNIWRADGGQNAIPDFALDDVSQTVLDFIKDDVTLDKKGAKENTFLLIATEQRWFDTDRLRYTMKPLQAYHDHLYATVLNRMAAADISERFDSSTGKQKAPPSPLQRSTMRWAVIQTTIVAWGKDHFQRVKDLARGLPVKPRVSFNGGVLCGIPGAPEMVSPERKEPMQLKSPTLLISELYVYLLAPRLDFNVTKDPRHLLKAPFSVHPSTGFVCVPFDPFASPGFVPSSKIFFPVLVANQRNGIVPLEKEIQFFRDSFLTPYQLEHQDARVADSNEAVARASFERYWPNGF
jgi:DNA primase catalytic subunit